MRHQAESGSAGLRDFSLDAYSVTPKSADQAVSRWTYCFVVAVLLVLWLSTRTYFGITHDFRFYLLWALARLDPTSLQDDLYLRFGSQDNFSIYSYLLSRIVSAVGPPKTSLILTLIGSAMWISGAAILARSIFPAFLYRVAALVAVVLLPAEYSGDYPGLTLFRYDEAFPSPRLFVEAIILISIAFALRQAWWRTVALLAVALAIHPLMATPGVGIVFLIAAQQYRMLWLLPFLGVATMAGLAQTGVEPFVRLGQTITGDWWIIVSRRCHFAFITDWNIASYVRIALQANIGLLAFWLGNATERRLLKALAVVVVVSCVASLIGAEWLQNLLVINAQLGRSTWLLSCIINLLAGGLMVRLLASRADCNNFIALGLALYALYHFFPLMTFLAFPVLAAASLALWYERRNGRLPHLMNLALLTLAGFASLAALLLIFLFIVIQPKSPVTSSVFLNFAFAATALCAGRLYLANYRMAASLLVAVSLAVQIANFDHRSPWQRLIDSGGRPPDSVMALIDGARNVYWEEGVEFLWFDLHKPSYFSISQGSGAMFYRGTALEYVRRGETLALLNTRDFGNPSYRAEALPKQDPDAEGPTSAAQLEQVCRALPDLDLLVLLTDVPAAPRLVWHTPVPQYLDLRDRKGITSIEPFSAYYFYKCSDFRASSPT